ncbi:MAG: PfkB family carbohydrate kinase [Deltaproteobacteria bacterium]
MSIIVLGTVALDSVKTPYGARKRLLGGSAVHFSMSCRLFTEVHLVAVVGRDFPARHIDFLEGKGLVLTSLIRSEGKTFHWEGEYKGDLNSAITKKTELGVLLSFCPQVSAGQRGIRNVFLANVDPSIQLRLLECMRSPRLVGLDSMNYWIHTRRRELVGLLPRVDIYVANEQEAKDLSGESNLIKAAKGLRRLGAKMVLIKKGEHGVLFYCDSFIFSLPAYPVETVIDPTGAGDTFAGGFMGYLCARSRLDGKAVRNAIAYGTVAASFNVERFGVERTAALCRRDLEKRIRDFKTVIRL